MASAPAAPGAGAGPSAAALVSRLGLSPHPEGGFYKETFRDAARTADGSAGGRAASTAILYLLPAGAKSRLHRLDASEAWHAYMGFEFSAFEMGEAGALLKEFPQAAEWIMRLMAD
ncbi:hypothetical protein Rsub_10629 [Raphidocelis subcapitata]|uniref:DUF985 domain-containing protein n=1 Tax=Raphidocelis subcapitata TaxID=307507 RepID=A0A2V0PDN7_9CHLO|nr:hypothetical protein Rsub_10629 [Raphidocelis subcapitata]|eukprot:GBF97956.1 hypothetical protein Rsub_10629 [Raphidocelis subcapitata]